MPMKPASMEVKAPKRKEMVVQRYPSFSSTVKKIKKARRMEKMRMYLYSSNKKVLAPSSM